MKTRFSIILGLFTAIGAVLPSHPVQAEPPSMRFEAQSTNTPSAGAKRVIETESNAEVQKPAPIDVSAEETPEAVPAPILPSPVRTIVIDPGHGGTNEGAIGVAKIHEKHLTLQVALMLADRLRKAMPDAQVILTRERDVAMSLTERIEVANRVHADLFLSLHFNSSTNPEAIGFESFWVGDFWEADMNKAGTEITDEIRTQREHAGALGMRMAEKFNRSMRHRFAVLDRGVKPGDYTVLTRAEVPAVVLELAFLSHAREGIETVTATNRAKLVDALTDAVLHYTYDKE